ncbi:MAG: glycogen synthase [bacterium]
MNKKLKILFASYECAPFLKRGGLGDVSLGLPKALNEFGADCRVIMPNYKAIDDKKYKLKLFKKNIAVKLKNTTEHFDLYVSKLPDSKGQIYFIDHRFFQFKNFFGYKNDVERFFFFSRFVLESMQTIDFKTDIIHCNDWHTALIPLMLKKLATKDKFFQKIKTVYTIHNLAYQGKTSKDELEQFNISAQDLLDFKRANSMAQGIADADLVTTVSGSYAKEILTKEYGEGLEKILQKRKKEDRLVGIINGLDFKIFNPKTDSAIKQKYDLKTLDKKIINKKNLQKIFGLEINPNIPLIAAITRLVPQKGLEMILDSIENIAKLNCQFVLIGSGESKYEIGFAAAKEKYPNIFGVKIGFDAKLAQEVYAGSDMFLMPSRYEPCGLGQLIAMRYGSVPIARATGGLKDTVMNYKVKTHCNASLQNATGFVFQKYDSAAMMSAVKKAVKVYNDKKAWNKLVKNCMTKDFSWEHAAKEYIEVYKKVKKM